MEGGDPSSRLFRASVFYLRRTGAGPGAVEVALVVERRLMIIEVKTGVKLWPRKRRRHARQTASSASAKINKSTKLKDL
jgi:hypothetical protein